MNNNLLKTTKVGNNLAKNAEKLISEAGFVNAKILFVTDEKIWKNCSKFFSKNFLNLNKKNLILKNAKADENNLKKISNNLQDCNLIVAFGSGVISDLCKFTSSEKNVPYIIFPSAASMNGYLSKNASITIDGHKKTLAATLPKAVFCDLEILKNAPKKLTKAGIGDLMCFYNCWFDWYLSHKVLGTEFNKKAFLLLEKQMQFFVKNFHKFSLQNDKLLKLIIEILLLSGQSMTIAEGSYPASQAEHLIAHTIEMKYKKITKEKLHGELIAVTSILTAKLQKKLLKKDLINFDCIFENEKLVQKNLTKFFGGEIANQCLEEYKQKVFVIKKAKKITLNWQKIKQDLEKIYFDEFLLKKIFSHFKIKYSAKSLGLSSKEIQACTANAKFIRNRFTCLDLK